VAIDRGPGGAGGVNRRPPDCSGSEQDRARPECAREGTDRYESNGSLGGGCTDANGDGRCDDLALPAGALPPMPNMLSARLMGRGIRNGEVRAWLGEMPVSVRLSGSDRNGVPAQAVWYDRSRQIVQVWVDDDRDGRADRIAAYRDGQVARVVQ